MELTKVDDRFHEHDLRAKAASDAETLEQARNFYSTQQLSVFIEKTSSVTLLKRKTSTFLSFCGKFYSMRGGQKKAATE